MFNVLAPTCGAVSFPLQGQHEHITDEFRLNRFLFDCVKEMEIAVGAILSVQQN